MESITGRLHCKGTCSWSKEEARLYSLKEDFDYEGSDRSAEWAATAAWAFDGEEVRCALQACRRRQFCAPPLLQLLTSNGRAVYPRGDICFDVNHLWSNVMPGIS